MTDHSVGACVYVCVWMWASHEWTAYTYMMYVYLFQNSGIHLHIHTAVCLDDTLWLHNSILLRRIAQYCGGESLTRKVKRSGAMEIEIITATLNGGGFDHWTTSKIYLIVCTLKLDIEVIWVVEGEDLFVSGLVIRNKLELLWEDKHRQLSLSPTMSPALLHSWQFLISFSLLGARWPLLISIAESRCRGVNFPTSTGRGTADGL